MCLRENEKKNIQRMKHREFFKFYSELEEKSDDSPKKEARS